MKDQAISTKAEYKYFASPDEVRTFEKGKVQLLNIGGGSVGMFTLEPGWQWSKHVKSVVKTDLCLSAHFQYVVSGRLRVKMSDGSEFEVGPGSVSVLPSGHDAWVVGDEPFIGIDWAGAAHYAK